MNNLDYILLLSASLVSNMIFMLVVPFLPLEFSRFNISETTFGIIFSMHPFSSMIGSIISGRIMGLLGRKLTLTIGSLVMGSCMVLFSSASYLENSTVVVGCCILSRAIQGFSSSMIQTPSYAIISICYRENKQKYLGYYETSQGLGCVIGPVFGGILYAFFGFNITFYSLGGILISLSIILHFNLPNSLNETDETLLEVSQPRSDSPLSPHTPPVKVSYAQLFNSRIFSLSAVAVVLTLITYSYYMPVIPLELREIGLSDVEVSLFFLASSAGYLVCSIFFVPYFIVKLDQRAFIAFALLFDGIDQLLIDPVFPIPRNLTVMIIGQFIVGVFCMCLMVSLLTVMINESESRFPEQKAYATDFSSGTFNAALQLGQTIGPVFASFISSHYCLSTACKIVCLVTVLFSFIYGYFCIDFSLYSKTCESKIKEIDPETNGTNRALKT
ncbi:unnamed protein product [Moneuplotes crassus]|uniref:Major facilitator superfamily (MFS) profile domain-containing protein n=1 Tax=Euplotes crassus TaxID=5936 RepID=A0AAD1UIE6_EUPCR|nr:unnamed protein product [Moneuplotes crassus]